MTAIEDTLAFLLRLNFELADKEAKGQTSRRPAFLRLRPIPGASSPRTVFGRSTTPDLAHPRKLGLSPLPGKGFRKYIKCVLSWHD